MSDENRRWELNDLARRLDHRPAAVELRGAERVEWSRSPERRYEGGRLTLASGKVMELPSR